MMRATRFAIVTLGILVGAACGGGSNGPPDSASRCSTSTPVCTPNTTQTVACGNCGTATETCDACGQWSQGACSGQGVCSPDATQSCGTCGTGTQTCSSSCAWSACTGVCTPQAADSNASTVAWESTRQTISGFGASNHAAGSAMNTSDDFFFSTLGYSLLRIGTPEDAACACCDSVSSACAESGDSVADMKACVAHDCQVWATSWTPPARYKTNGIAQCLGGGFPFVGALNPSDNQGYANFLSNYIASLEKYAGVTLYAISPQNEPDTCALWDSSAWNPGAFDTFITNYLGPTLHQNGQGATLIMMPEPSHADRLTNYGAFCMDDPTCAAYVGITGFHDYGYSTSTVNPWDKPFWLTEVSQVSAWDPSIQDAMYWAGLIDYNVAVVGENAWHYWWAVGVNNDNEGLINGSGGPTSIRAYVIGNYAKFIRPGWVRVDARHAPQANVTVSAYKSSVSGHDFALVATNQNTSSATQSFTFSGTPTNPACVTPTITSGAPNQLLTTVGNVCVTGGSFTYTLPAQSVVTFTGSIP
jgi:glucuronoarabinoxylan endo-1,4-beta-xylanase